MKIVKTERIILSQTEITVIEQFQELMESIHRGTSEPSTEETIDEILGHLNDLKENMR